MASYTKNSVIHHSLSHYAKTIENEISDVTSDELEENYLTRQLIQIHV